MTEQNVNLLTLAISENFTPSDLLQVRSILQNIDDKHLPYIQALEYKNPTIMLIFSLFLGSLGVDRFLLGDIGLGILKLITCGACGIWTIVDWFTVMNSTKSRNFKIFLERTALLS